MENVKDQEQKKAWIRRFDFFAFATWLVLSVWLAGISLLLYGQDFRGYYAAAQVLLAGGNPYDYHQVAPVLLKITGEMGNNPYYYPPWFAWFFIPIVMFSFQTARAIWMAINLAIWNFSLWKLGNLLDWPSKGWKRYMLYSLATFSFGWITWRYEQAGILIFALLIAVIITVQSKQWAWAGFWMALLSIKPNITLIVLLGASLWLIRMKQWRPVLMMMLWLLIFLVISTWITPDWYKPFFDKGFGQGLTVVLDGPDQIVAVRINTTLVDWLETLGIAQSLQLPLYGLALLTGIVVFFLTVRYSQSFLQVIAVSLIVSYALTPYAMQYDNPSLIIAILWALSICSLSSRRMQVAILLAGFVFSVIFWQRNIAWAYWMVVGSAALTIWAVVQKKGYSDDFRMGISNNS